MVESLDGIIGWLTELAKALRRGPSKRVVGEVLEEGGRLAMQELEHFLRVRPLARERYLAMLKGLAGGPLGWSELKRLVEHLLRKPIYSKNFTDLLNNLVKAGFVERSDGFYALSDPVLLHALKKTP